MNLQRVLRQKHWLETAYFFKKYMKRVSKRERNEFFYETIKPAEQNKEKLNSMASLQSEIAV